MSGANSSPTADIAPVIIPLYDDDEDAALAEDHFPPVANDAVSLQGECTSSNADIT